MNKLDLVVLLASALLCGSALFFGFWPLIAVAVALLVLYGHTAVGIVVALTTDLLFGAPVGLLSYLHFPFLLFALFCVALRQLSLKVVLERGGPNTI
jgi:hypothetical protein